MAKGRTVVLCDRGDLADGEIRRVDVAGHLVLAVYRIDGNFYATDDTCTHGAASLSEGFLDGHVIECPFHGGAFDVTTGRPVTLPCATPLKTYTVTIEGDAVRTEIDT